MGRIRVNITVDEELLKKAKTKLNLFGGKLSTLFNAYLDDFVKSIDKPADNLKDLNLKIKDIENRLKKIESNRQ